MHLSFNIVKCLFYKRNLQTKNLFIDLYIIYTRYMIPIQGLQDYRKLPPYLALVCFFLPRSLGRGRTNLSCPAVESPVAGWFQF